MNYFAVTSSSLFFVIVIICLFVANAMMKAADRTDSEPPPPVPEAPDAIEVAYLDGGADRVIQTVAYALVQRGFVAVTQDGQLARTEKPFLDAGLAPIESFLLASLQADPQASSLFDRLHNKPELEEVLAPVRARLAAQNLLQPVEVRQRSVALRAAVSVVLAVSLWHFSIVFAASGQKEDVGPVVLLAAASIVALLWVTYAGGIRSKRGQAYLSMMQLAYRDRLRQSLAKASVTGVGRVFDGSSLFLVGLYGLSVLKGTPDETIADAFRSGGEGGCGGCGCGGCGG